MSKISKSPDRNTFQLQNYMRRQQEQGLEPLEEYIEMHKTWREQDAANIVDPEWQKNNMEYDLRSCDWMCAKVRADDVYAQNLYASMCNRDFQKLDVIPILKDLKWSCSWRHAGGIVADMQQKGDYIDWYCSGIRDTRTLSEDEIAVLTEQEQLAYKAGEGYVSEGCVTDEIKQDLKQLGWIVLDNDDKE